MNKHDLAQLLAKQSHRSRGKAADAVDALVHRLLKDLKTPKPLSTPASSKRKAPREP
jgi:nucleoid DNA-binding protein